MVHTHLVHKKLITNQFFMCYNIIVGGYNMEKENKGKRRRITIIMVIIMVVVMIASVLIAQVIIDKDKEKEELQKPEETPREKADDLDVFMNWFYMGTVVDGGFKAHYKSSDFFDKKEKYYAYIGCDMKKEVQLGLYWENSSVVLLEYEEADYESYNLTLSRKIDVCPRPIKVASATAADEKIIRDILDAKGYKSASVFISEVITGDFSNSGKNERIIVANTNLIENANEYDDEWEFLEREKAVYSLLVYVSGEEIKVLYELDETYDAGEIAMDIQSSSITRVSNEIADRGIVSYYYSISSIYTYDINGDGKYEVFIKVSFWEGIAQYIIDLDGKKLSSFSPPH